MNKKFRVVLLLTVLLSQGIYAQRITGKVFEVTIDNRKAPLSGAGVYWAGTTRGTQTDSVGFFSVPRSAQTNKLVFSYVGYVNDTVALGAESEVEVFLRTSQALGEVTVSGFGSSNIDRLSPIHTELITTKMLAKAACCNLSESFETNASVSVSYSDAVTGAKQVHMLGLSGTYIQTNVESIPTIRGLATTFGLNYIPGTWIHSIDLGKGVGSVVNGYESMTGLINVELHQPDGEEKFYFNAYGNNFGRGEANLNWAHKLNEKWSTGFLTHASTLQNRVDRNKDGFLDLPLYKQFNGINRWKYSSDRWMAQFGIKALYEDRLGGETDFQREMRGSSQIYGFGSKVNRYEAFGKLARLFPDQPYRGLGLVVNASSHDQKSYFGVTDYNGRQNSLYSNLVYQSIIDNTNHSFKTGVSYLLDDYNEVFADTTMKRTESVPGVFFEYTYNYLDKFMLVAGGRADFHNLYGTQFTPRVHLKYNPAPLTTVRLSAGRGFRVSNPLAEYFGNLVSSRQVVFRERINPEVSWNFGASITQELRIGGRQGNVIVDFYRTDFDNQLVADMESANYIYFYNLQGKSFANSFQAEINFSPVKRFETKLAYRYFDVKQTLTTPEGANVLTPRMGISRDRVLFNVGYALPYDKWKFDFTTQWNGTKRMPVMEHAAGHHSEYSREIAPSFYNFNAQVTRTFPKWDFYVGGENLGNFRQMDPVMGANDPFGSHFDGGMAWGPVTGRMIYLGVRYKITE